MNQTMHMIVLHLNAQSSAHVSDWEFANSGHWFWGGYLMDTIISTVIGLYGSGRVEPIRNYI